MVKEVFSVDSVTSHFNRSVSRIKKDSKCVNLLANGNASKILAYGSRGFTRWGKNISSRTEKDRMGAEHMYVQFYVEGPAAKGTVHLHVIKSAGEGEWNTHSLTVDVPGHQRIVLEGAEKGKIFGDKKDGKLFGVKWW